MKVELIEQLEPFSDSPWYGVKVNGSSIKWTREKEVADTIYNDILTNPDLLKTRENVLKSEEVEVSLDK
jgi:hypothetical protein